MITVQNIIDVWNAQADEYNQWSELDEEEKIDWTINYMQGSSVVIANVMSSRFDEAIEKVRSMYGIWLYKESIIDIIKDLKDSAIASQKISET